MMLSQKQIVLQKCYRNITYMYRAISPQTFYYPSPKFHAEIDTIFANETITQCSLEAPRGTAKSTKAISKILHNAVWAKHDKVIVIQSKTREEAARRLTKIKNILEYSKVFRALFDSEGLATEANAMKWQAYSIQFKLKNPLDGKLYLVTIAAIGTGQQARGILEDDTRITLYLLDDPDDEDNTLTKDQMNKNFDKFLGNLGGLDVRYGRVIVIGTPVREGCIVERLRNAENWLTRKWQAYTKTEDGIELLWEEMYSYEWLMQKKKEWEALGKLSKFYSEYMCEIVGDEDRLFKKEYLRWYEGELFFHNGYPFMRITHEGDTEHTIEELKEPKIIPAYTFVGIDPASSQKQTADYSVTFPGAYDGDNIFCLDYFRKRVAPTQHAEQIIDEIRKKKFTRGQVETVAYQEMLRDYLRKRLKEENMFLPGLETKFNPRTEKSARLETLHPLFFNRKVWVKPSQQEFVDELMMYPRGKHDDTLDGFYYMVRRLIPPHHTWESLQAPELSDDEAVIKAWCERNGIEYHAKGKKSLGWMAS